VPPDKVGVVMNVANSELFRRRASDPQNRTFTVVYHGTFTRRYGVDLLVEAAALVRMRGTELSVCLLGDGEHRNEVGEAIARLGLEEVVEMSDGMLDVSELQPYLEMADVGVVPNRSSIFTDDLLPTKLMEYVAVGIPVVTSRTPMIASYFDDEMVEFFTPGDAAGLAARLTSLASSPERRQKLAQAADRFHDRHNWEHVAADYVALVGGDR
jgi:glycosyltransferase involved in cell wall biosynthesis